MTGCRLRSIEAACVSFSTGAGAQLVEVLPVSEYEEDHLPGEIDVPASGRAWCCRRIDMTEDGRLPLRVSSARPNTILGSQPSLVPVEGVRSLLARSGAVSPHLPLRVIPLLRLHGSVIQQVSQDPRTESRQPASTDSTPSRP